MKIIEALLPMAASADASAAILPLWQVVVLAMMALSVIFVALTVWVVLRVANPKRERSRNQQ